MTGFRFWIPKNICKHFKSIIFQRLFLKIVIRFEPTSTKTTSSVTWHIVGPRLENKASLLWTRTVNLWVATYPGITLVNDQLDTQLFYFYYSPLYFSSNVVLIIGKSNCTNTASGIVTLCTLPSGMQVKRELSTCTPDGHLQRVTIPDALLLYFELLMMSTTLLETCRGL